MTFTEQQIKQAYQRSGLAFLGISYAKAMAVPPIRTSLECAVKAGNKSKGNPAPIQPALI